MAKRLTYMLLITLLLNSFIIREGWTRERLIPFQREGKWGYKDARGKEVMSPQFIIAQDFSPQGIAAVVDERGWAYIDTRGKVVIRPFIFDNGPDYFREGLARFTDNNKFGFFDEKGRVVIKPQFDFAYPFSEGLAAVCNGCKEELEGEHRVIKEGKWGYVGKKGKVVIPLKFAEAKSFENGKAQVKVGNRWIYIDTRGREVQMSSERLIEELNSIDVQAFALAYSSEEDMRNVNLRTEVEME